MITKPELDKLAVKYETKEFFYNDPIGIPNLFSDKKDKEIVGFIASLVAYGRREIFLKKLHQLLDIAQNEPCNFIMNFEDKMLGDFNYRFGKPEDFSQIFYILKDLYKNSSLEELFKYGYEHKISDNMFIPVTDYFYSHAKDNQALGFKFMIPDARKGSAMKRMCMYLRWMVRKGNVDFGIWNFMPASDLLIPLDTHVARISRKMGLLSRKANDFKSVIELTENLKRFDKNDPVKYDFAIFGYGVNNK